MKPYKEILLRMAKELVAKQFQEPTLVDDETNTATVFASESIVFSMFTGSDWDKLSPKEKLGQSPPPKGGGLRSDLQG
jgi:hypothetical protein